MPIDASAMTDYANKLAATKRAVRDKVIIVVHFVAADIERTAKQMAPVDTGALRNSIGADFVDGADEITATIGPTVSYAPYQEFGTSRMAPHPFMGPAVDTHEGAFHTALQSVMDNLDA